MKYFIDFEATQYTQEIIQIGCVGENGRSFSSLIRPRELNKVTKTITELTGITKDQLFKERYSDEVFSEFFEWLCKDNDKIEFLCYGNSDKFFAQHNIDKCTKNVKAQASLSMIVANLTDATEIVKEHFRLEKAPSLKKVMEYYFPKDEHICHDALSDAEMLRAVYFALMNETKINGIPFPDYIGTPVFKNEKDLDRFVIVRSGNGKADVKYKTLNAASGFIIKLVRKQCKSEIGLIDAQKKVLHAINNKKKYFGYDWTVKLKNI